MVAGVEDNTTVQGPRRARRHEKVAEQVAREILRDIQREGLQSGATLPSESVMLERFDIGRGSLREALRILEVNGLVTIKTGPGGGPIVTESTPVSFGQMWTLHLQSIGATYRELLEARVEYESILARRAAERVTPQSTTAIADTIDETSQVVSDDVRYASAASGFHSAVCAAGDNSVMALAANAIQSLWSQRVTTVLFAPEDRPMIFRQHRDIARAIERGNGRQAEKLMREHMQQYQEYCERRYPARLDDVVDWS
jgi:DNA-binding FadR family transcriptional regulator